jgi:hypothetical protein
MATIGQILVQKNGQDKVDTWRKINCGIVTPKK